MILLVARSDGDDLERLCNRVVLLLALVASSDAVVTAFFYLCVLCLRAIYGETESLVIQVMVVVLTIVTLAIFFGEGLWCGVVKMEGLLWWWRGYRAESLVVVVVRR